VAARLVEQIEPVRATLCGTILVNGPGSHRDTAPFTQTGSLIIYGTLGMLGSHSLYWYPAKTRLARGDGGLHCFGSSSTLHRTLLTALSTLTGSLHYFRHPCSSRLNDRYLRPSHLPTGSLNLCEIVGYSRLITKQTHSPSCCPSQHTVRTQLSRFRLTGTLLLAGSLQLHRQPRRERPFPRPVRYPRNS